MRRITWLCCLAGLLALTGATAILAHRRPAESLAGGAGSVLALQTAAAVALVVAGLLVWTYRAAPAAGALFLAAGLALDAQALPLPDAGGAVLFTLALVLAGAAPSLAGVGALELGGRADRLARSVAFTAVAICAVWAGALPTMLFDPPATGCFDCPRNLLLVHGVLGTRTQVLHSGLHAAAIASAAFAVLLFVRLAKTGTHWSVALCQLGAVIALVASAVAFWSGAGRTPWVAECVGLCVVAAGPVAEIARARVQSARIVDAVLRTVPTTEELRVALATSAGDRSLSIVFLRETGEPVDGAGDAVAACSSETVTTDVVRAGEVVAQLRHRPLSRPETRRLTDAVRAAGLALEHTSSRARLRAELAELTASRARIVEAADAERRRLERNLHDGAQQRLIALSVALGADPELAEARGEVLTALEELRTLAHGIHPASLTDGGIVPSVRELADASTVPLRLDVRPLDRLPTRVESTAYRVVADSVRAAERHGRGQTVSIALAMTEAGLIADVCLPGVPASAVRQELRHADDRVVAAGGMLSVRENAGDETRVELRLRCAS